MASTSVVQTNLETEILSTIKKWPKEEDIFRQALPTYERIFAPAEKADAVWLVGQMTRAMALMGGGWPVSQRSEWISIATEILSDQPFFGIQSAFPEVFQEVRFASEVVPWVSSRCEALISRYREDLRIIRKVLDVVDGANAND